MMTMHNITTAVLVLICCASIISRGFSYYKVQSESCSELSSSSSFFDSFLLPCAKYSSDSVELRCLNGAEIKTAMSTVPKWQLVVNSTTGDSLKRSFEFSDFQNAFLFMASSAQLAEKNQHHPDWRNLYNTVDVVLTTDDQACLSTFDFELAQGMDLIYSNF